MPVKPEVRSSSRRAMKARRMMSLRSGHWPRMSRSVAFEISYASQTPRATALTTARRPVRCATSPVNSPGPRTTTVSGASPDSSMISISPDLMTKNLKSRSPASNSFWPSACRWRTAPAHAPSLAICPASSLGNAAECSSWSIMGPSSRPPTISRSPRGWLRGILAYTNPQRKHRGRPDILETQNGREETRERWQKNCQGASGNPCRRCREQGADGGEHTRVTRRCEEGCDLSMHHLNLRCRGSQSHPEPASQGRLDNHRRRRDRRAGAGHHRLYRQQGV